MPTTTTFDQLYAARRNELYGLLAVSLGDANLAADAVDEGLAVAYRKRRSFDDDDDLLAAAFAAATEWASRNGEKNASRGFRLERSAAIDVDPHVAGRIESMPVGVRAALVVDAATDWDQEARAAALGVEPEQADRRIARAREAVAELNADRVEETVRRLAVGSRVPMARPEFVKTRARQSLFRRLAVLAAGFVLLAATVAGGAALLRGDPEPTRGGPVTDVALVDDGTVSIAGTDVSLDDLAFTWSQAQFGTGNIDISSIAWSDGDFIASGRTYNQFGDRAMTWTSPDGLVWTGNAINGIPRDAYVSALRVGDDAYYAAGLVYNQGPPQPFLWSSTDLTEWTGIALEVPPIELDDVAFQFDSYVDISAVASFGTNVVVGGGQHIEFNPEFLFRDKIPVSGDHGFGWSTGGPGGGSVEVYGRNGEIVFSSTFEDLGVPVEVIRLIEGPQLLLWSSRDGSTFTSSRIPELSWINSIAAGPTGFVVAGGTTTGTTSVFQSADAVTWTKVEIAAGGNLHQIAGTANGFVALESLGVGSRMWVSPDGVEWTNLGAAPFNAWQIGAGPLGYVVVGTSTDGLPDPVAVAEEVDGYEVTVAFPESVTVRDLEGNLVAEYGFHEIQHVDAVGSVVMKGDTDEVLVRIPERLIEESASAFDGFGDASQQGIWYSPFGREWVRIDGAALGNFSPNMIAVGASSVLVAGWQEGGGFGPFGGGGGFVTWVGSPAV